MLFRFLAMILIRSHSLDPYRNLAIEDVLLDRDTEDRPALFLWRSADTVVIGKNQNPWQECNFTRMRAAGIRLARRTTGGGAVVHDEGNLNFAVLCLRSAYRQEQVFDAVIGALHTVGLQAQRMGKSSLAVDGCKVSGNAFCYRRNRVLHHGTLLICSDLAKFKVLEPRPNLVVTTRAVRSEPADVVNLVDLRRGLDVETISAALIDSFTESFGRIRESLSEQALGGARLHSTAMRLRSPAWIIGHGPKSRIEFKGLFPWGEAAITLEVNKGWIESVSTSGFDDATTEACRSRLRGCWLTAEHVRRSLGRDCSSAQLRAISDWLDGIGA